MERFRGRRWVGTVMENWKGEEIEQEREEMRGLGVWQWQQSSLWDHWRFLIGTYKIDNVCASVHVRARTILCHSFACRKILSVRTSVSPSVPGYTADSHSYNILFAFLSLGGVHGYTCLISGLFPILISHFLSVHPSKPRQPSSQPSIPHLNNSFCVLFNNTGRAKLHSYSRSDSAPSFKPPFWAGVQTTNNPLTYSSWEPFRVTQGHCGLRQESQKIPVYNILRI